MVQHAESNLTGTDSPLQICEKPILISQYLNPNNSFKYKEKLNKN